MLPDNFQQLKKLKRLNLARSDLKILPAWLTKLTHLEELDASNNQLAELPASIGHLHLRWLNLANNLLRTLPNSLARIRTLETLDLSRNPLDGLPDHLQINRLNIADCPRLRYLPSYINVNHLELGGTNLLEPAPTAKCAWYYWHRVLIDRRIAFRPDLLTYQEIFHEENLERRRMMMERMGYERFLEAAGAETLQQDVDAGGVRQLLRIDIPRDEPLVCLQVVCPSTGHKYMLRVPPRTRNCHEAAAWIAGFDDPQDYDPVVEADSAQCMGGKHERVAERTMVTVAHLIQSVTGAAYLGLNVHRALSS